jgi:hypothetical protein
LTPISQVRNKLVNMRGVKFEWNDNIPQLKDYSERHNYLIKGKAIGFIAQEIEELFPDLVWTDKYGYKNLQYEMLVSVGIAALQENQKRVEALKNFINDLNSKISG